MRLGIALGGGGVAGCAHLGVLQALEEAGIKVHCLAGTSAGGLISALYAYGYSVRELISEVPSLSNRYLDYDFGGFVAKLLGRRNPIPGFIKGKRLHQYISMRTEEAKMHSLWMPVAIMAVDLQSAKRVIFSSRKPMATVPEDVDWITEIDIADAVRSSCSIPFLFHPVRYQNRLFVDGGLLDNCPVSLLRSLGADKTIAVDLVAAEPAQVSYTSCLSILSRVVSIHLAHQAKQLLREADLILRPEARHIGAFQFQKSMECIEYGYDTTRKRMGEIKSMIKL